MRGKEMPMSEQAQIKEYTIIVNGREKTVTQDELSYDQVVALAFGTPPGNGNTIYTIRLPSRTA
jgi:hypothetical protein